MSIRILLVEDDDHICNTVRAFLAEAGYQVDACTDGNEAYTKFYEKSLIIRFSTLTNHSVVEKVLAHLFQFHNVLFR